MNKKSTFFTFIILCSLLMSENTFALWGEHCCIVTYHKPRASEQHKSNSIDFYFKFFEYELPDGIDNYFLEKFEVYFSMNYGKTYTHLMSASTENQRASNHAWIDIKNKFIDAKMNISVNYYSHSLPQIVPWENGTNPRIYMKNKKKSIKDKNTTWILLEWLLREDQKHITDIRIVATWHTPGFLKNEFYDMNYAMTKGRATMKSNSLKFLNSFTKDNTVNAIKLKCKLSAGCVIPL